ncbi:YkgJ family cysteine cluster protein [Eubacterium limosum]|uniref:YkgJ family cysteine cluster protein n=1 Tax=Eubacterium limosum TaxID=1736 RepID=UPI00106456F3|nr:hypothetical protein [Eubacterium limosum]
MNKSIVDFECKRQFCEKSCCGMYEGMSDKMVSVENRPFNEIILLEEDVELLNSYGFERFYEESEDYGNLIYRMKLYPDGTCNAYDNGLCTLQDCKPTLCKAYPFYFDQLIGLCCINCPGIKMEKSLNLENNLPFIQAAIKMQKFWISYYSKLFNIKENEK